MNIKEIRNMKLDSDFCINEKSFYEDFICSICTNIFENPISCAHCETVYCKDCYKSINNNCPNCRKPLKEKDIGRFIRNQLIKQNCII